MYLKVLRCLRQGAGGTMSPIKPTLWGSNAPCSALLCSAFDFGERHMGPARSEWGSRRSRELSLRQGGRGLAAAELSLSRRRRLCRCNSVKHFIIKYGTLIWLLPQHRCYTQPKKNWARWGRWHHRRISERSFRIAWKLHVHCARNVKRAQHVASAQFPRITKWMQTLVVNYTFWQALILPRWIMSHLMTRIQTAKHLKTKGEGGGWAVMFGVFFWLFFFFCGLKHLCSFSKCFQRVTAGH